MNDQNLEKNYIAYQCLTVIFAATDFIDICSYYTFKANKFVLVILGTIWNTK
jgi:hypothetical protein